MEEVKETKEVGLVFGITANTQVGESILIVGEAEELGKWNPDKAVQLCTDHKSYPVWSSANPVWICPKPGRKRLEYKYLRDRRELGQGYVWEDDIPNRCLTLPPGGVWVLTDRLWNCPGELKIRPGSRHGSFESRRALVQPIDCDIGSSVPEHLFTPTQRKETREMTPSAAQAVRRGSSSLLDDAPSPTSPESPTSPTGKMLQREASASILCRQASDLKRDSSQAQIAQMAQLASMQALAQEEEEEEAERQPSTIMTFDQAYMLVGDEPLGEGSFGLVWRCQSRTRDGDAAGGSEERAAKRITRGRLAKRDERNLFGDGHSEGEIKMHQTLSHPHIVGLYEVFQDDEVISLVMECCQGGDLFDLIASHAQQGGLAEHCAARVQVHLLSAIAFLHELPVVHRDVKCENVLLAQKGVPPEQNVFKLCDFGFAARPRPPAYRLHTRMGSPDTVAPEVVRGEPYWAPVDCWACGVLLYMSLSASPPFYAQSDAEVLNKVRNCIYKLDGKRWSFVSDDSKGLIRQLMKFEPSGRATAKEALEHPFLLRAGNQS
ncbi:Calcium-dependent protein kinase 3 [Durusdinium trenchii]|uniref:Calcium-dependent protein kinase 3 n=1 Tax=Durusdinium trenchii TaxID=1381693 RepID=A0ABP0S9I7_9DINO